MYTHTVFHVGEKKISNKCRSRKEKTCYSLRNRRNNKIYFKKRLGRLELSFCACDILTSSNFRLFPARSERIKSDHSRDSFDRAKIEIGICGGGCESRARLSIASPNENNRISEL